MRLALASAVSLVIVLAAPFMGQIRAALQSAFPKQFVLIVGGSVAAAIGAGVLVALARIRERRAVRLAAIVVAVAIGAAYTMATATGRPEVDAVERVHFVEYGLIALLFCRVWKPAGDPSMVILPLLAALIVGTLDEWLQWFIPVRVGEARDVVLNVVAIGCGLLFGIAVDPPPQFATRLRAESLSRVGLMAAGALLVFAAFFSAVHLGHVVQADGIGQFESHYTPEQLEGLSRARVDKWRTNPPLVLKRLSREDQYMDEGLWHVRRRNESWSAEDFARAWSENLILERFYSPVLDTPSYVSKNGNRWPPEHRRDAEQRAGTIAQSFVSDAEPYPIVTWPKVTFWIVTAVAALLLVSASRAQRALRTDRSR